MIIHSPIFSGSITQAESAIANLSGSFSGSFTGVGNFVGLEADSVAFDNVTGKPTLVSGSSQVSYPELSNIPSGIVSSSAQLSEIFLDTLGDGVFSGSSQVEFNQVNNNPFSQSASSVNVSKSIIPTSLAIDLGSVDVPFRDLYLSSASLYINGQQVISSTDGDLNITTDANQSLRIIEEGVDTITLQTENGDITLVATGTGTIELNAPIRVQAGKQILSSDGNAIVFGEDISVTGNIAVTGEVDGVDISSLKSSFDTLNGKTLVSGSAQVSYPNLSSIPSGIVSGSSQVVYTSLSSIPAGIVSGSSQVTSLLPSGVVSGSTQVQFNDITNNPFSHSGSDVTILAGKKIRSSDENTIVIAEHLDVEGNITVLGAVDGVDIAAFKSDFDAFKQSTFVTASSQVTYASISSIPSGIVSGSTQVTPLLPSGVVSGSSQVNADTITNFDANVKTKLDADLVVSGSSSDVKTFLSLQNVTNESKATMFTSPTFTGTPVAPTAPANTNSTQIATTAYVQQELTDLIGGANEAFDTLIEISASLASGDSQLNTLVDGKLSKTSNLSDLTNTSTARINLGVAIGSDVQAYHANLAAVADGTYTGDDSITTIGTVNAGSVTAILPSGTVSGSSQVVGILSSLNSFSSSALTRLSDLEGKDFTITLTGDVTGVGTVTNLGNVSFATTVAANSVALGTDTTGNYVGTITAGNGIVTTGATTGEGIAHTISVGGGVVSGSAQIDALGFLQVGGDGVVSGSSQINHDSTTGFVANEHIDHSSVSITAGNGLTGGGTIAATRTINVVGTADRISVSADAVDIASTYVGQTSITTLGTIGTGTWQGSVIASAYLDADTAHLSGTQTFTGAKTFSNSTASTTKTTGAVIVTGGVGIGGALNVGGDVVAYASSDRRLKDNIQNIENPIQKVQKLNGVTWDWNSNADELQQSLPNVGVIAQEVEEVFPQLVHDRDNGYKGVDYAKLTGLLIEAIKEQQKQIDELKSRL